jgi:hypothetical protein
MEDSQSVFGAAAVAFLPRFFLPKSLNQRFWRQIRHTVRSAALKPAALASSASRRRTARAGWRR